MKRRNKNKSVGRYIVLVSSIAMINIMGVSYAYWNDNLNITTTVSTGKLDVKFCNQLSITERGNNADGDLKAIPNGDGSVTISGWANPNYQAFVDFCVENVGTIPFKLVSVEYIDGNNNIEKATDLSKIHIHIPNNAEGDYDKNIIFKYSQWNNNE